MRYGLIQYLPLLPVYMFNCVLFGGVKRHDLYQVGLVANSFSTANTMWLIFVLFYNFYACDSGLYDSICTGNYVVDFVILGLTLLFQTVNIFCLVRILIVLSPNVRAFFY